MSRFTIGEEVVVLHGANSGRTGEVKSASSYGYTVLLKGRTKSIIYNHGELRRVRTKREKEYYA